MLMNLQKKTWTEGLTLRHAVQNCSLVIWDVSLLSFASGSTHFRNHENKSSETHLLNHSRPPPAKKEGMLPRIVLLCLAWGEM